MKQLFFLIIVISTVTLAFGYWHSITHGSANIDLRSTFGEQALSKADVFFMDANDEILAKGIKADKYNHIYLIHPEVGNCHDFSNSPSTKKSRQLWQDCFQAQSTWIPTWIKNVHQIQIKHKNCFSKKLPITISEYNTEWVLWWVPLPHIGGLPYTYFRVRIVLNQKDCITDF